MFEDVCSNLSSDVYVFATVYPGSMITAAWIPPLVPDIDCKQSLSGQSRRCTHSAARLERGEINEKRLSPFSRRSPNPPPPPPSPISRSAISHDLSTIQKGTACSLSRIKCSEDVIRCVSRDNATRSGTFSVS